MAIATDFVFPWTKCVDSSLRDAVRLRLYYECNLFLIRLLNGLEIVLIELE